MKDRDQSSTCFREESNFAILMDHLCTRAQRNRESWPAGPSVTLCALSAV